MCGAIIIYNSIKMRIKDRKFKSKEVSEMITKQEHERIVRYMKRTAGIELGEKKVLIQGRLDNYIQKNHHGSYDDFMDCVEKNPGGKEVEFIMNALTTNHTYFWREYEQFLYLKENVLPELKQKNKKDWRIWCAACSSGEEPYTLEMLCKDFLGLEQTEYDTQILATDIDTNVLEKAIKGVYPKESVEHLPEGYVRRYFKAINETEYIVKDELKKEVIFRQFNLMNPLPFRKPLHVVFIRNVMIYFDDNTKADLLARIYDKMEPGGYLFTGSTESLNQCHGKFKYIQPSVYRK